MKRFFILALAFTVLSSVLSVYFSDTAKAESPYDYSFQTYPNDQLKTGGNQTTTTFEFGQMLKDYSGSSSCSNELRLRIVTALEANADYVVVQSMWQSGNPLMARMYVSLDGTQITNTVANNWTTSDVSVTNTNSENFAYVYFLNKSAGDRFQCGFEGVRTKTVSNDYGSIFWGEAIVEYRGF